MVTPGQLQIEVEQRVRPLLAIYRYCSQRDWLPIEIDTKQTQLRRYIVSREEFGYNGISCNN